MASKIDFRRVLSLVVLFGSLVSPLLAQGNPTARISGQVSDPDGAGLPGVTVTFESAVLQGARVTVSEEGGNYTSPPLPPGVYTVSFELQGYQPVAHRVRASAAQALELNAQIEQVEITEEIVVSGEAVETVSSGNSAATTITYETLEDLPAGRDLDTAMLFTPGVQDSGINGITISGAQSNDSLFTLNGVVLNENIRGQAFDLYIEDAIQETTAQVGGISAEYGRFTGGVVTAITKSGGNDFSGSFRVNLENDDWLASNRFSPEREDEIEEIFEATFGGRIVRDRLWFFAAGRDESTTEQETTTQLNIPFPQDFEQERIEGKLTGSITPQHQVGLSYIEIDEITTNIPHGFAVNPIVIDDGSLDPEREDPQELQVLQYTGVLTDNFFLEAQYAEREFTFVGGGGEDTSFRGGTPVWELGTGGAPAHNASVFCGVCPNEERDNEQARLKGTYFLSTQGGDSHDMVFGAETFTDIRKADNHQSANDWFIWNFNPAIVTEGDVFPVFAPFPQGLTEILYLPILNPSQGTDFQTDSLFYNDTWRLNDAWSFNLGARYDRTDAVNSNGADVADSDEISPRVGLTWTPGGDSPWNLHAYAGRYVGIAANGVFDNSSPAGNPASFEFLYLGPTINTTGPAVDTEDAVQTVFDWLFSVCPGLATIQDPERPFDPPSSTDPAFTCPLLIGADIPGFNLLLDDSLAPNSADELKLGFSRPLGQYGVIRGDAIYREWQNFFITRRDLTTGQVTTPAGTQQDLGIQVNDDDVISREYLGLDIAVNLALLDRRLRLGGALTVSELTGNTNGETGGSGPIATGLLEYPEYRDLAWNAPEGRLTSDRPIKLDLYGTYDLLRTAHNRLAVSLAQSFDSGTPYGAVTGIEIQPFVDNPGYATPPPDVDYWFTDRDAFDTDDLTRTDVGINYAFQIGDWELFVQPEVLNVFNEDSAISVNTTVLSALDDPSLQTFNPFTETPVEGVHWRKGDDFGEPTSEGDLQRPREFRVSVGFKFNP